jgi:ABC-type sugar transport system ATPase subunit
MVEKSPEKIAINEGLHPTMKRARGIRTTLDRLPVIYVTRDILQVRRIADRVVIMENGEKVADVEKHEMTGEELEHIIRDGGRQVAA